MYLPAVGRRDFLQTVRQDLQAGHAAVNEDFKYMQPIFIIHLPLPLRNIKV